MNSRGNDHRPREDRTPVQRYQPVTSDLPVVLDALAARVPELTYKLENDPLGFVGPDGAGVAGRDDGGWDGHASTQRRERGFPGTHVAIHIDRITVGDHFRGDV